MSKVFYHIWQGLMVFSYPFKEVRNSYNQVANTSLRTWQRTHRIVHAKTRVNIQQQQY